MLCEGVSGYNSSVNGFSLPKFGEIVQANMFRHSRPHFANNDYGTAELACSTAHAHHKVLAGHGLLCTIGLYASPPEKQRHYCCVRAVSVQSSRGGENIAYLPRQPGERLCLVAVPARRE